MKTVFEKEFNKLKDFLVTGKTSLIHQDHESLDYIEEYLMKNEIEYRKYSMKEELYKAVEGVQNIIIFSTFEALKDIDIYPINFIFIPMGLFIFDIQDLIFKPKAVVFLPKYDSDEKTKMFSIIAMNVLEYDIHVLNLDNPFDLYVQILNEYQNQKRNYIDVIKNFHLISDNFEQDLFVLCLIIIMRLYMAIDNINMFALPCDFDNSIKILSKMLNISSFGILKKLSYLKDLDKEVFIFRQMDNKEILKRKYDYVLPLIKAYKKIMADGGFHIKVSFRKIYDYISYAGIFSAQNSDYFQLFLLGLI